MDSYLSNINSYLFVQSEKSKKAGNAPPTTLLVDFLKASYQGCSDILLLEEDMNFNSRAASLSVSNAGVFKTKHIIFDI